MQLKTANPALGGAGLAKAFPLAGMHSEYHSKPIIVQRLQRRFGFTESVAGLVAHLASLGPQEGR
jgi:hypothetical protein